MHFFYFVVQLHSPHGPPIFSFLRKHPHVAKRKDRDRIIEAETYVDASKNLKTSDENPKKMSMFENHPT